MTETSGRAPAPGWYVISTGPTIMRWWDGSAWSDDLVARRGRSDRRWTVDALLRNGRWMTVGTWILAGAWTLLTVVLFLSPGYGFQAVVGMLAPVAFIVGGVILQSRLTRYRRLLAPDAPPPIGLVPAS